MSYTKIVDFSTSWTSDVSGLWTAQNIVVNDSGFNGNALSISAQAVDTTLAYVEFTLPSPFDLSAFSELRFWVKSSRVAMNFSDKPFYMRFIARPATLSGEPEWYRIIPIQAENSWDLVRLWIEDMPTSLRTNFSAIRIEALAGAPAFSAQFFSLLVVAPNAIADTEQSLINRYNNRFRVETSTGFEQVTTLVQHDATGVTAPSILISPLSMNEIAESERKGRLITDNYTFEGSHTTHTLNSLSLQYAIDVVTARRSEAVDVLTQVISDLFADPVLFVAGQRTSIRIFEPSAEIRLEFLRRASTPLFISIDVPIDVVTRSFNARTQPFLSIDANPPQAPSREIVQIQ